MIPLFGRALQVELPAALERQVWPLVGIEGGGTGTPSNSALLVPRDATDVPNGFGLYVLFDDDARDLGVLPHLRLPAQLGHLVPGDMLSVSQDGFRIRVVWRTNARQNSLLLTERCDNLCLMCSQPPKRGMDDWLLDQAFDVVRRLPPDTAGVGFTGGEPTIHGERLVELLHLCRDRVPDAGVHVLSNGRRFADPDFARAWATVGNPRMMVGIPLYGSEASQHDYVVQSAGAFDETVAGILNLASLGQSIEIRVVIHRQTADHLSEIADFIGRNLPFVDQVALMGLEMMGLARANIDLVWIDPIEYQVALRDAVMKLARRRIHTMIYNHQLCLLDRDLWPYAVQSISDWKNEYLDECSACSVRDECGGLFSSAAHRRSDSIAAIQLVH